MVEQPTSEYQIEEKLMEDLIARLRDSEAKIQNLLVRL